MPLGSDRKVTSNKNMPKVLNGTHDILENLNIACNIQSNSFTENYMNEGISTKTSLS